MSSSPLYLKKAEELRENAGQWGAYNSTGHCVVLAGPGSGKTKTLTLKLAKFLAEDVDEPRGVACITYNNECARELETRLEALGIEAGGRIFIGTVHSFSLTQIILPYAASANMGLPVDFSVATRSERRGALERAYDRVINRPGNPHDLDFTMGNYRRSILNRESEVWNTRDPELAALVVAFEEELRAIGRIDFDDMPLIAMRALRDNPWLQRAILAKYPILAVDEYQDLGHALHRMVMGLCFSAGMRLFAVGDVDQSIYGFTGANPTLLQSLSERGDVETVRLRLNYRCGTNIVTASSYALGEERDYEAPDGAHEGTIFFHPLNGDYPAQAEHIFTVLLPQIIARNPDIKLGDIAILYPAAWIGDHVANAALNHNFATIRTDTNSLYPRGNRILRWLEQCAEWCCGGWQTGSPRFRRIMSEGFRIFAESLTGAELRQNFQRELLEILWSRRDAAINLHVWLTAIFSSLLDNLASDNRALRDEIEVAREFIERTGPEQDCETMVLGQFAGQASGVDCVNLSTLHSSKGREFTAVIMFGMDAGRIPRANASQRDIRESRRLFYVGFTRAKLEQHLVYSSFRASQFVQEVKNRIEENII